MSDHVDTDAETAPPPALGDTEMASDGAETTPLSESRLDRIAAEDGEAVAGRRLKHFQVEGLLGEGGMAKVYRAFDVSLERVVALKVFPPELTDEPQLLERFQREARSQAAVSHPNVVPIYYVGEDDGLHFFAMEYVEGHDLSEAIGDVERLEWETAVEHMIRVADALREAHRQGLIHRDLKPGNLLVGDDGRLKVADFGLARPIEQEEDAQLTAEGTFMGTPLYVAPEQARGESVDHRADMYALGATFHHLLTGRPLFEGPTPMAIAIKHASESPPDIRDADIDVPPRLARVLGRLLKKNPEDRFDDYDDLLEALEACRPTRRVHAGFWARAFAAGIDLLVLLPFAALGGEPNDFRVEMNSPIGVGVFLAYLAIGWGYFGKTVGKWLLKLRVVDEHYESLTLLQSLQRIGAFLWGPLLAVALALGMEALLGVSDVHVRGTDVSAQGDALAAVVLALLVGGVLAVWGVGLALASFHPEKRALHDLLSGTRVIYDD